MKSVGQRVYVDHDIDPTPVVLQMAAEWCDVEVVKAPLEGQDNWTAWSFRWKIEGANRRAAL